MHQLSTSFILGYHGCKKSVAEALLGGEAFALSENKYDWLGHGVYFWEANPRRGIEFFREAQRRSKRDPDDVGVVGAVIDLGHCLDLSTSRGVDAVSAAYGAMKAVFDKAGFEMPVNHLGKDLLSRDLDCAVINFLHETRKDNELQSFDSVRGVFQEGGLIYPTSGFHIKTHVQIAVRDLTRIKGVFRVPAADL